MPFKYTYIMLLVGSIFLPLILSFDGKVAFYKRWPQLISSIIITAILFISWDIWFTSEHVWSFNHEYVLGYYIWGLPLEEWLFFFIIPYACIFIYDVFKAYMSKLKFTRIKLLKLSLLFTFAIITITGLGGIYTSVNFGLAALLLAATFIKKWNIIKESYFFLAYAISLVPFVIVNGVLTAIPVVSYDDSAIIGLRITSIPIEDTIYLFSLLLINIGLYEWFLARKQRHFK